MDAGKDAGMARREARSTVTHPILLTAPETGFGYLTNLAISSITSGATCPGF
jgi:mannose-1-phosphate guanylyltransferase